jgi:hypothetical protein
LPHHSCGFGSPEDAALIFVTFYQEKVKKNKPAGALEIIEQFYTTIITLTTDWNN